MNRLKKSSDWRNPGSCCYEAETASCQHRIRSGSAFLLIVFILMIADASQQPCCAAPQWSPWSALDKGVRYPCGMTMKRDALLLGGTAKNGDGTSGSSTVTNTEMLDTAYPRTWRALESKTPIAIAGQTLCTRSEDNVFLSSSPSHDEPHTQLFMGTYVGGSSPTGGENLTTHSMTWEELPSSPVKRRRGGLGASNPKNDSASSGYVSTVLYFFGGTDASGKALNHVDSYNVEARQWSTAVAEMPTKALGVKSFCDCQVRGYAIVLFLLCGTCEAQTSSVASDQLVYFLEFNVSTRTFRDLGSNAKLTHDPSEEEKLLDTFGQYAAILSIFANGTNPSLHLYDVYLRQWHTLDTMHYTGSRGNGTFFRTDSRLVYAGGRDFAGSDSSAVSVLEPVGMPSVEVNRSSREYFVGEVATVATAVCSTGMVLRLSTTEACTRSLSSTPDAPCIPDSEVGGRGSAMFNLTEPAETLYICMSFGVCSTDTANRVPCELDEMRRAQGANTTGVEIRGSAMSFEDCLNEYCCYDEATHECFEHSLAESPASTSRGSEEDLYFILTSPRTITVNPREPSKPHGLFSWLFSTKAGFAVLIVFFTAVVLLVIAAVLSMNGKLQQKHVDDHIMEKQPPLQKQPPALFDGSYSKYRFHSRIGAGAFGQVYRVERKSDGRTFALKFVKCSDEEERGYALKEFDLMFHAQGHPNLVHLEEMFMCWEKPAPVSNDATLTTEQQQQQQLNQRRLGKPSKLIQKYLEKAKNENFGRLANSGVDSPLFQHFCVVMDSAGDYHTVRCPNLQRETRANSLPLAHANSHDDVRRRESAKTRDLNLDLHAAFTTSISAPLLSRQADHDEVALTQNTSSGTNQNGSDRLNSAVVNQDLSATINGDAVAVEFQDVVNAPDKQEEKCAFVYAPRYLCLVMEYFSEGDLMHYVVRHNQSGSPVPERVILRVFGLQICDALNHLHSRNPPIVHRDLKPENILLRKGGEEMVLTDFGLAQQLEKAYLATRAGSLQYLAPECWERKYTDTVDMWAVGCIFYGMATGRVTGRTAPIMFREVRQAGFEKAISNDLREYSPLLRKIVLGLLQVDVKQRLTATQVIQMIKSADNAE